MDFRFMSFTPSTEIFGYGGGMTFPGVHIIRAFIGKGGAAAWKVTTYQRAEHYYTELQLKDMIAAAHDYIAVLDVTKRLTE